MSGIKYYRLAKGEEMPDEFCVVMDVDGEPSEYLFYVPETENAALREQMERLVTLLRNDCDIDASWDGLRRFWSIELTEGGCLMRDRACKAEAENARLRAASDTWAENDAKLRELVRDMHTCMEHYETDGSVSCDRCPLDNDTGDCDYERRMRELGIEVDADA